MQKYKIGEEISAAEIQQQIIKMIDEHRSYCEQGQVADYIPMLGEADPCHLGVSVCLPTGEIIEGGDKEASFTIQSISKVIALALALLDWGEQAVFEKVGMEPTGDPFHSIYRLETMNPSKPLNPMINAGAIAVTALIQGKTVDEKLGRLLEFVHDLTGNASISVNEKVAQSESETADLNRALTYFLREYGVVEGEVEQVLDVYFRQCAIEMKCRDLAKMGAVLANDGKELETGQQIIPSHIARICKTFMVTCGMYNASGEFAIRVGIPAKTGVSGAILGAVPPRLGLGIYSPALDEIGNSVAGIELLQSMSKRWQLSIF